MIHSKKCELGSLGLLDCRAHLTVALKGGCDPDTFGVVVDCRIFNGFKILDFSGPEVKELFVAGSPLFVHF